MLSRWIPPRSSQAGFTLIEVLISFFIFGIVIAGLIYGYIQMNRMATWASWSLAAQSLASEGMEEARGAQWNELGGNDQWPPTTNSSGSITPYQNTNCSLDVPSTGTPIWVTNFITISTISVAPPLRMIRSDCVWTFPFTGQPWTNTVITLRAPDQ
ncbi:MAG: prepilin-type N-terminal cleavage/methylation domain-containing protein [Verrucomicrobiota bacterium]|jgi:prepilin-type N-terminal cleavage/methylation domain-containing protein